MKPVINPQRVARWLCILAVLACPLFAADNAAVVEFAQGDVSVIKDDGPWALFDGDSVSVGQTITTGADGYAQLSLSDGSSFTVYPDSKVVFRSNPGSVRDLVDVFLGRIKVHIEKLGGRPNPTRVFSPTAVISVRGTTFDVQVDSTETTTIMVDEGLVTVNHRLLPSNREVAVGPGEYLVVYPEVALAQARVNGVAVARVAQNAARTLATILDRIGRRGQTNGSSTLPAGIPGDTSAPPAPLPGDSGAPEPPPPPE